MFCVILLAAAVLAGCGNGKAVNQESKAGAETLAAGGKAAEGKAAQGQNTEGQNAEGRNTEGQNTQGQTAGQTQQSQTAPEQLSSTTEPVRVHAPEEPEEPVLFYEQDGKQYQKVPDLITGEYLWASAVTDGTLVKDSHGHERADYNTQERSFERVDGQESVPVRRWDNLLYSAGEYLIFEYDGTVHVSKSADLYHPVLSYEVGATHGIVTKVPDGYMTADTRSYEIRFYDMQFQLVKAVSGYRAGESGLYYEEGLMAVRDMKTGLMGYMDQKGGLVIPCIYAAASDFSNGYASVLTDAQIVSYTEDAGTIQMFYGKGGQWGIIDLTGSYALEPSPEYANAGTEEPEIEYYNGIRRFGPVREDGTVDFIASDQDERVIETVSLRK